MHARSYESLDIPIRRRVVPVVTFAAVMGLVGLGLAWRPMAPLGPFVCLGLATIGAIVFVTLATRYVWRAISVPSHLATEIASPAVGIYFGAIPISLSLFASALQPVTEAFAMALFALGAAGSVAFAIGIVVRWIVVPHALVDVTPGWLMPLAGPAVAVPAAIALERSDVGWALFAISLLCWSVAFPIVLYRLIARAPLPPAVAPALGVLVSSSALLANAWFALDGGRVDAIFTFYIALATAFAFVVIRSLRRVATAPPPVSWWGYTFPAAALAGAFVRLARGLPSVVTALLAWSVLAIATFVVAFVTARTLASARTRVEDLDADGRVA